MTPTKRRIVIKIGSAIITNHGMGICEQKINQWIDQIITLKNEGFEVTIVSSGAVAEGLKQLQWTQKPKDLNLLQAAAAVGQMRMIQVYQSAFSRHKVETAQILLTHQDFSDRNRYLNAGNVLNELFKLNVVPIINENDTITNEEICFGDNDQLAALVTNLIQAERLIILTDQDGLYDQDPTRHQKAKLIQVADPFDESLKKLCGKKSILGSGGMQTKLKAANLAAQSNAQTIIANGTKASILIKVMSDQFQQCTRFISSKFNTSEAKKLWLLGQLKPMGTLTLDQGACHAIQQKGKSLLAVGVVEASGQFSAGNIVRCIDQSGRMIAKGLVNYSSQECAQIIRMKTEEIESILGFSRGAALIHRNHLALTKSK